MAAKKVATGRRRGGSDVWKDHDPPIATAPVDHRASLESVRFLTATQYRMHRPDAVPQGGGEELARMVEDVKAGRPLRL